MKNSVTVSGLSWFSISTCTHGLKYSNLSLVVKVLGGESAGSESGREMKTCEICMYIDTDKLNMCLLKHSWDKPRCWKTCQHLLVWKSILFFDYCELSDIFTGQAYFTSHSLWIDCFFVCFLFLFLAFDFCWFCMVYRFFHPRHNDQWLPTSKDFLSQILSISLIFLILILEKEPVFSLLNVQR